MAIVENEGQPLQDRAYRQHLNRNWDNINGFEKTVNKQIKQVLSDVPSSNADEVTQLRIDVQGTEYPQAKPRVDSLERMARSSLQQLGDKASTDYVESFVKQLLPGTPQGTYATISDLKAAYPNGTSGIYITTDNGHWNYYIGGWKDGGSYQNREINDNSIESQKLTASAKRGYLNTVDSRVEIDVDNQEVKIPVGSIHADKEVIDAPLTIVKFDYGENVKNYTFNLYFDLVNKNYSMLNKNQLGQVTINMMFVGLIDIWNKFAMLDCPYVFMQNPSALQADARLIPVHIINGPTTPINFDLVNKKVEFPEIPLRVYGHAETGKAITLDLNKFSEVEKYFTLVYDVNAKLFNIYSFNNLKNMTGYETPIGVFNLDEKTVNINAYYTINGSAPFNRDYLNSSPQLIGLSDDVIVDFKRGIITIPSTTNLAYKDFYVYSSILTGGKNIELKLLADYSEQRLLFNTKTNKFRLEPVDNLKVTTKVGTADLLIAILSKSYEKVIGNLNFKVINKKQIDGSALPDYVSAGLTNVYEQLQTKIGLDKLTLGYITDTHGYSDHIKAISELSKQGVFDAVVHGGDIVTIEKPYAETSKQLKDTQQVFADINVPLFIDRGNHDGDSTGEHPANAGYDDSTISSASYANRLTYAQAQDTEVIKSPQKDGYFYVDFNRQKIRAIFTNSSNGEQPDGTGNTYKRWSWDINQLNWIVNTALNFDEKSDADEWQTVVFGHHNMMQQFSHTVAGGNGDLLAGVLNAFVMGEKFDKDGVTSDFKTPHVLIGYFFGHTHCDALEKIDGFEFYQISTASSLPDYYADKLPAPNKSWPRPIGTLQEDCWDSIVIDPVKRQVDLIRFGAGVNRTLIY